MMGPGLGSSLGVIAEKMQKTSERLEKNQPCTTSNSHDQQHHNLAAQGKKESSLMLVVIFLLFHRKIAPKIFHPVHIVIWSHRTERQCITDRTCLKPCRSQHTKAHTMHTKRQRAKTVRYNEYKTSERGELGVLSPATITDHLAKPRKAIKQESIAE